MPNVNIILSTCPLARRSHPLGGSIVHMHHSDQLAWIHYFNIISKGGKWHVTVKLEMANRRESSSSSLLIHANDDILQLALP